MFYHFDFSLLAQPTLVSSRINTFNWTSNTFTVLSFIAEVPRKVRGNASTATRSAASCMQIFSEQLPSEKMSAKQCRKKKTQKNYSSIIRQRMSFCSQRGYDPNRPSAITVLAFLTFLFKRGIGFLQKDGNLFRVHDALLLRITLCCIWYCVQCMELFWPFSTKHCFATSFSFFALGLQHDIP